MLCITQSLLTTYCSVGKRTKKNGSDTKAIHTYMDNEIKRTRGNKCTISPYNLQVFCKSKQKNKEEKNFHNYIILLLMVI